jgi:hypothetical protein
MIDSKRELARLKVASELFDRKYDMMQINYNSLLSAQEEMKKRHEALETMYMNLTEENLLLREREVELRNSFEGGATREEFETVSSQLSELQSKLIANEDDIAKCVLYISINFNNLTKLVFF